MNNIEIEDDLFKMYDVRHSSYEMMFQTIKFANIDELKRMFNDIDKIKDEIENQILLKS